MKIANPQGKGTDLLVNHWYPQPVLAEKPAKQIVIDYFSSSLVLSASFSFKPVVNKNYHLYWWNEELRMSLIEPEKLLRKSVSFIGSCSLKEDLTWNITFHHTLSTAARHHLQAFYEGFEQHMQSGRPLSELFPSFIDSLPYYRRLFASGLSKSLGISLAHLGLQDKTADYFGEYLLALNYTHPSE